MVQHEGNGLPVGRTIVYAGEYAYASTWRRAGEWLVDRLLWIVGSSLCIALCGVSDPVDSAWILLALFFVYFFLPEALWGRTLGKLIFRTRVVDVRGGRPSWWRVALRTAVRLVPLDVLSFGMGWDNPDSDCAYNWHDSWSGTYVVATGDLRDFRNLVRAGQNCE